MPKATGKYERAFLRALNEDVNIGSALGGSPGGFEPGSNINSSDFYAPGDSRLPASVFGGVLTRKGISKKRRRKRRRKNAKRRSR
jgi:hypothetical protein